MSLSSFAKHAPEICTQNTFCPNHNYCVSQGFGVMIIVRSKECVSDECPKEPSYGVAGSRKAVYCAQHALEGMVGVYLKKCVPKLPTYGISGSRKQSTVLSTHWRGWSMFIQRNVYTMDVLKVRATA